MKQLFNLINSLLSEYPQTQSGVISCVTDWDLNAAIDNAEDDVKLIFDNETLAVPDDSKFTIDQNTKVSIFLFIEVHIP